MCADRLSFSARRRFAHTSANRSLRRRNKHRVVHRQRAVVWIAMFCRHQWSQAMYLCCPRPILGFGRENKSSATMRAFRNVGGSSHSFDHGLDLKKPLDQPEKVGALIRQLRRVELEQPAAYKRK